MKINDKLLCVICVIFICIFSLMSEGYADDQRGVTTDTLKIGLYFGYEGAVRTSKL